ncbi:hypothetical protein AAFF_G00288370 [Aldrovandia affinis]|uniref:Uncharacterized protein n=1 Tax=Aldrovandia affinis TaxID=143900 RepID=A0AAD7SRA0_9TELE|nr:hypothetical protein AAFF_G00288370 [Aldrovandia affinis]
MGESAVIDGSKFALRPGTTWQSYFRLVLLALTVGLSAGVYLCVLRYICTGCCKPVVMGPQTENLAVGKPASQRTDFASQATVILVRKLGRYTCSWLESFDII